MSPEELENIKNEHSYYIYKQIKNEGFNLDLAKLIILKFNKYTYSYLCDLYSEFCDEEELQPHLDHMFKLISSGKRASKYFLWRSEQKSKRFHPLMVGKYWKKILGEVEAKRAAQKLEYELGPSIHVCLKEFEKTIYKEILKIKSIDPELTEEIIKNYAASLAKNIEQNYNERLIKNIIS